ncbi:hypothetical protein COO91_03790 [Nostoc flagelliforme CCNUN1]|uniref:Uncharacterized protein n=1 Tax=Nostoc flagelliforme CCNUN1 TaxID=2038116 RepID=A0A2K8SR11_9NOSO|nr:hypothetical protein COO91_03790 [Nostoc flagelliforme CCNUN1]
MMVSAGILNKVLIFKIYSHTVARATLPSLNSSLAELQVIKNTKFCVNLSSVVFEIHVSS